MENLQCLRIAVDADGKQPPFAAIVTLDEIAPEASAQVDALEAADLAKLDASYAAAHHGFTRDEIRTAADNIRLRAH